MKILLLLLLLVSCGGHKDAIKDGAVLDSYSATEFKINDFCSMAIKPIALQTSLAKIESEVFTMVDHEYITMDQAFDATKEIGYMRTLLNKLEAKDAYVVSAWCMEGYSITEARAYGELSKMTDLTPLEDGMIILTKEQMQKIAVESTKRGAGL